MEIKSKLFRAGETVLQQGDQADCAYIIERGVIKLCKDQEVMGHLTMGEVFGELALLDDKSRAYTAIAAEDSELYPINRSELVQKLESADGVVHLLLHGLIKHLRGNNLSKDIETGDNKHLYYLNDRDKEVVQKIKFENDLVLAIKNKEFRLFMQPIINLEDQSLAGYEALIRWNSPKYGMVRPDLFIAIAEETSLIVPIGDWVIEEACKNLAIIEQALRDQGNYNRPIFMDVNVSPRQFLEHNFADKVVTAAEKHNIDFKNFKLEVTERIFMAGSTVFEQMEKCKTAGFELVLDDFGTGYSSLSYLLNFPVSKIKIDRSFMAKIHEDFRSRTVTEAIVKMAARLGVPVVAEGIETERQMHAIRKMGCEFGQGYYYSKPVTLEETLANLKVLKIAA